MGLIIVDIDTQLCLRFEQFLHAVVNCWIDDDKRDEEAEDAA